MEKMDTLEKISRSGRLDAALELLQTRAQLDTVSFYPALEHGHIQVAKALHLCGASFAITKEEALKKEIFYVITLLQSWRVDLTDFSYFLVHAIVSKRVHLITRLCQQAPQFKFYSQQQKEFRQIMSQAIMLATAVQNWEAIPLLQQAGGALLTNDADQPSEEKIFYVATIQPYRILAQAIQHNNYVKTHQMLSSILSNRTSLIPLIENNLAPVLLSFPRADDESYKDALWLLKNHPQYLEKFLVETWSVRGFLSTLFAQQTTEDIAAFNQLVAFWTAQHGHTVDKNNCLHYLNAEQQTTVIDTLLHVLQNKHHVDLQSMLKAPLISLDKRLQLYMTPSIKLAYPFIYTTCQRFGIYKDNKLERIPTAVWNQCLVPFLLPREQAQLASTARFFTSDKIRYPVLQTIKEVKNCLKRLERLAYNKIALVRGRTEGIGLLLTAAMSILFFYFNKNLVNTTNAIDRLIGKTRETPGTTAGATPSCFDVYKLDGHGYNYGIFCDTLHISPPTSLTQACQQLAEGICEQLGPQTGFLIATIFTAMLFFGSGCLTLCSLMCRLTEQPENVRSYLHEITTTQLPDDLISKIQQLFNRYNLPPVHTLSPIDIHHHLTQLKEQLEQRARQEYETKIIVADDKSEEKIPLLQHS